MRLLSTRLLAMDVVNTPSQESVTSAVSAKTLTSAPSVKRECSILTPSSRYATLRKFLALWSLCFPLKRSRKSLRDLLNTTMAVTMATTVKDLGDVVLTGTVAGTDPITVVPRLGLLSSTSS